MPASALKHPIFSHFQILDALLDAVELRKVAKIVSQLVDMKELPGPESLATTLFETARTALGEDHEDTLLAMNIHSSISIFTPRKGCAVSGPFEKAF
jgi:hypothetical protein